MTQLRHTILNTVCLWLLTVMVYAAENIQTPSMAYDQAGTLWVVYVDGQWIKLIHSEDNGISFSEPIKVNQEPERISADGENRPKIAFGQKDELYLTWSNKRGRTIADVRFSRSTDGGETFSYPITINDDGFDTSHRYETLTVDDNGTVYIAWLDKRDVYKAKRRGEAYLGSALYYTYSTDQGKTFARNIKVADHTCQCCRIGGERNTSGGITLVWRHIYENNTRDHAMVNINNDSVSEPERVTFDDWSVNACPHHGPDIASINDEHLHLSWFTGKESMGGLHYAQYSKTHQSLQNGFYFDDSPRSSRPQVAVSDDTVLLVWKTVKQQETLLQMVLSADAGKTWSSVTTLATAIGRTDHPQLILHDNHFLVGWQTQAHGLRVMPLNRFISVSEEQVSLKAYREQSLEKILTNYQQQPLVVVLWSQDCAPCYEELALLQEKFTAGDIPNLVLIATDPDSDLSSIEDILREYDLSSADNWYFDGQIENLRYSIDPDWYGELPRSYFFSPDGERQVHRGLMTETLIEQWLGG